jgi:CubicO group peptidase (beta-lactamase class C family)
LVVALVFVARAPAEELQTARPADVGLSAERLDRITAWLNEASHKGTIPGAALMVIRHGKVAYFETMGVLDPETKTPMRKDAIFRIYSMSKPITTVAVMMLVEQGKITLDEPIAKYIPAFKEMKVGMETRDDDGKPKFYLVDAKKPITIQDLLRHTSGITYGFFGDLMAKKAYVAADVLAGDYDNAEFAERIAKLPLAFQPGTTWDYSHSTDILGRLVEVVSGQSLYQFEKQHILDPLGMSDTSFYVGDQAKHARIAEPFPNDRTIGPGVTFSDPRAVKKWESGGGGMVGTVTDYARFLMMLRNGGTLDGSRIIGRKTLELMASDHLGPEVKTNGTLLLPGHGFGLGFAVRTEPGIAPFPGSVGQYFWSGIAGTFFWIDPKEDLFAVFMSQGPGQRDYTRTLVRDLVYAAVD